MGKCDVTVIESGEEIQISPEQILNGAKHPREGGAIDLQQPQ